MNVKQDDVKSVAFCSAGQYCYERTCRSEYVWRGKAEVSESRGRCIETALIAFEAILAN